MENHEDRARFMMSEARKEWHNPETVLGNIGIKKGMTLVDLGAGPGFFTIPMAQVTGENGTVYAVDSDPTMLEHLRDNIAKSEVNSSIIKIIRSDVCDTGLLENSVDVAFFANVFHEVENKKAFLQEVKRICKPTARVVDVDWKKVQTERGPPLKIRLSEEEAAGLLSESGFTVLKQMDAGPKHYELICKLADHQ
ncbi:MAG TPA: class I SAM-dependent methyltransferase [Candidatus Nanoarchaeia archaeon]|nr:class I SAM-dependent methyltransferase [Candidatus Nanoarchaeia archaeon]